MSMLTVDFDQRGRPDGGAHTGAGLILDPQALCDPPETRRGHSS
jgi:hypothetical protein